MSITSERKKSSLARFHAQRTSPPTKNIRFQIEEEALEKDNHELNHTSSTVTFPS